MTDDDVASEAGEIWPNWTAVPKKIRREVFDEANRRFLYETFEFTWSASHKLSLLGGRNNVLLPSDKDEDEWGGVYRIFLPDTTIDRFCGSDSTGTLYLGMAGTGAKSWSILKTRIGAIARGRHHATAGWHANALVQTKYPWETISLEWASVPKQLNAKGRNVAPKNAEFWLLRCYTESFGEFPPLNQKG